MLIIVCGLPGSGKTSLSRALAKRFAAEHISSDLTRKRLVANPTYSQEEKKRVYDEMARETQDLLMQGKSVIADATFQDNDQRTRFSEIAASARTGSFIILCTLPEERIRRRLERRMHSASDADFDVYLKVKKEFKPLSGGYLTIDNSAPLKECV